MRYFYDSFYIYAQLVQKSNKQTNKNISKFILKPNQSTQYTTTPIHSNRL